MSKEMNKFILDLFNTRYSCKGYDSNRKVSDEDFKTIMDAARLSPSSMGLEPWHFVRLKNKEVINELSEHSWGALAAFDGASHIVLLLARTPENMKAGSEYLYYIQSKIQKLPDDIIERRMARLTAFQIDDFKLAESDRALFDWTSKQLFIPMTSILLSAAALGVDSTPIEGFHQDKVNDILVKHGVYDGKQFKIVAMVALGYNDPTVKHREKTRRPLNEVLSEF